MVNAGHDQNLEERFSSQGDILFMCVNVLLLLLHRETLRKISIRLK